MDQAQRGFGSSAAAQAFKNKARLNTLEGTGKSYQSQENTNAQIRNAANMARQEAAMREAMMNNEIGKYNLENVYGYDENRLRDLNAITGQVGNVASQTFGNITANKNQLKQLEMLAKGNYKGVNRKTLDDLGIDDKTYETLTGQPAPKRNGGMMGRSFRNGGTNNPGFKALPEAVQENILNNMGMGGYMYSLGGRLMNDPMFAEGGKLPKNVLQSRLEAHMSPEEVNSYLSGYADGGIHIKPSKVGSLRKHLGTPAGEKIPMSKLADKPGDSPAIKKKKVFARNARKWNS
jgi:hypothetical protein